MKKLVEIDEGLIADLGFALKYLDELEKNPSRLFNLDQSRDLVLKVFDKLKAEWDKNNVKASKEAHAALVRIFAGELYKISQHPAYREKVRKLERDKKNKDVLKQIGIKDNNPTQQEQISQDNLKNIEDVKWQEKAENLNWMDLANWNKSKRGERGSWRKDELKSVIKMVESARKTLKNPKKLKESYLLRDICVSLLEIYGGNVNKIDIAEMSKRLEDLTGCKDAKQILEQSLKLWAKNKGYEDVQAYITPKSLLYTFRGDYDALIKRFVG